MAALTPERALELLGGGGPAGPLAGHELLAGHTSRRGTILVTRPRQFWPRLPRGQRQPGERDRAGGWLRNAMTGLAALALAAAAVSWTAQYRMVFAVKHLAAVSALEAGIPDAGAMIFASLGIALALHGRRAIRARALNVACVAVSLGMNALASAPGWRDLAIWVMPAAMYALASDTLIGVIRAWAIARQRALDRALAEDEVTPLAVLGGLLLWLLRLVLAPASTLAGFRGWVVEEVRVAPGRRAPSAGGREEREPGPPSPGYCHAQLDQPEHGRTVCARRLPCPDHTKIGPKRRQRARRPRRTKTERLLDLVRQRHGELAAIPLDQVSRIATAIAPEAGLHPASARTALLGAVRASLPAGEGDAR